MLSKSTLLRSRIVIARPVHGSLFLPKICALMLGSPKPAIAAAGFAAGAVAAAALRAASAAYSRAAPSSLDS